MAKFGFIEERRRRINARTKRRVKRIFDRLNGRDDRKKWWAVWKVPVLYVFGMFLTLYIIGWMYFYPALGMLSTYVFGYMWYWAIHKK